jgi:ABC-2 type transport system ATP-binding protein
MDTKVRYYSSGMFLRLAFSVCVFSDPDVFLVDEILSVGDAPFKEKCIKRILELQDEGKTLVIVSHSQEQISKVAKRCIWLEHGKVMADGETKGVLDSMNKSTGGGFLAG